MGGVVRWGRSGLSIEGHPGGLSTMDGSRPEVYVADNQIPHSALLIQLLQVF